MINSPLKQHLSNFKCSRLKKNSMTIYSRSHATWKTSSRKWSGSPKYSKPSYHPKRCWLGTTASVICYFCSSTLMTNSHLGYLTLRNNTTILLWTARTLRSSQKVKYWSRCWMARAHSTNCSSACARTRRTSSPCLTSGPFTATEIKVTNHSTTTIRQGLMHSWPGMYF